MSLPKGRFTVPRNRTSLGWGAIDTGRQLPTLNINTAEIPILRTSAIVPLTRKPQDTEMPICSVGRGAGAEGAGGLGERVRAGGVPEGYRAGGEVLRMSASDRMREIETGKEE
jgi:hypothetical protein